MEQFEKEKDRLQELALREKRQKALQALVESLKGKAQIEIQPKFLEES